MLGIIDVAGYFPTKTVENSNYREKFGVDEEFLSKKIGVLKRTVKAVDESVTDMCVSAFVELQNRNNIDVSMIDCCVVVTQNPDYNIPHTSAIVHDRLGLAEGCACFDISLGCSGYVYALSIVTAFMSANGLKLGLIFTADPYSKIVDEDDKNTALIFGDAASVTLIGEAPKLVPKSFDFGSRGKGYKNLINEEKLFMNGRAVYTFAATTVPGSVAKALDKASVRKDDIDRWYFHQGSKYIVDTLSARLDIDEEKVVFDMYEYGNTVSSSIPLLLEKDLRTEKLSSGNNLLLSGFGVGLSWASAVYKVL